MILNRLIDIYFEERKHEKERLERQELRQLINGIEFEQKNYHKNYYLQYNKQELELMKSAIDIAHEICPKNKELMKLKRKLEYHKIYFKLENNYK